MCSLVFQLLLHEIARTKLINSFSVLKKYRDKLMCFFFAKLNVVNQRTPAILPKLYLERAPKNIYYGFSHLFLSLVASVNFFLENDFRNI